MAIPLTDAWELVRLHLQNHRQPPYSKPWKPVSGDGRSHSTNFCDRSIIMQTAVNLHHQHKHKCKYQVLCTVCVVFPPSSHDKEEKKEKKKRELKRKCEGKKRENEDRFFGSSFLIPCLFPEEYLTHISVSVSVSRLYIWPRVFLFVFLSLWRRYRCIGIGIDITSVVRSLSHQST